MRIAALVLAAILVGGASAGAESAPEFTAKVEPVRWADLRHSYRAGCPVGPPQLRTVEVSYWDFAGQSAGRANRRRPAGGRRRDRGLPRALGGALPDPAPAAGLGLRRRRRSSMAADNTSGFNCRFVGGTTRWSMHAYGEAIDVNTVENPYVRGSTVSPPAGRAYLDRSRYRKGMAVPGGVLVRAFASVGWKWGASFGDYQHFSTTGR